MSGSILIRNAAELVTCSGFAAKTGADMADLHIIEDGAVLIHNGSITAVGKTADLEINSVVDVDQVIDATGKAVLPGFVDPHTHLVFAGHRVEEFSWRLRGDRYMDILQRGGGILSTVRETRKTDPSSLFQSARDRLNRLLSYGVTTIEAKSGYGLDLETEIKLLEVIRELNHRHPIDVVPTFLGAHAIPEEYRNREADFVSFLIDQVLPTVVERQLAVFCDVFCEKNVFSISQSRRLLEKAKALGLKPKLHADEMAPFGGAELAAEIGAVSADHLLHASEAGISAMAKAGVIAVLLPATAFCLREPFANAGKIIDAGGAVALATDLNPGSACTESIPLIFALSVLSMGMSTEEAVTAITLNAAAAIGLADRIGSIDVGKKGDLVLLSFPSYKYLTYHTGANSVHTVIKAGEIVFEQPERKIDRC